jgi:cardiolipin synthase
VAQPPVGRGPRTETAEAADAPKRVARTQARAAEAGQRARLTTQRLLGLDRSGPPPPETLAGHPLRPWTIPNAIGYVRAALIPLFLVLAYEHDSHRGVIAVAAACYFVAGAADYWDGIAARITGQYSRLGTLMDPIVDRVLVSAGVAVCWTYELLPRWALVVLLGRELLLLIVGRIWIRRGLELRINWPGRLAVGPTMLGLFLGLIGARLGGEVLLYLGLSLALVATLLYLRSGVVQLRERRTPDG